MTLQAKLDAQKEKFKEKVTAEKVSRMQKATRELRQSGIVERAAKEGERLPDFILPDVEGIMVRSQTLRAKGPLLVSLFRGGW